MTTRPAAGAFRDEGGFDVEDNERIVRAFLEAWSRLDPDELAEYFTEDAVYHNMPVDPIRGRENIRDFIAGLIEDWTETQWEINHLLVDGVFELENGKIPARRDYFDMTTYTDAIG